MSEMIERVARAIFMIAQDEAVSRPSLLAAERAIAAMREPTAAMRDACHEAVVFADDGLTSEEYRGQPDVAWKAMIAAALKETK
jgi:hypothetical protein